MLIQWIQEKVFVCYHGSNKLILITLLCKLSYGLNDFKKQIRCCRNSQLIFGQIECKHCFWFNFSYLHPNHQSDAAVLLFWKSIRWHREQMYTSNKIIILISSNCSMGMRWWDANALQNTTWRNSCALEWYAIRKWHKQFEMLTEFLCGRTSI